MCARILAHSSTFAFFLNFLIMGSLIPEPLAQIFFFKSASFAALIFFSSYRSTLVRSSFKSFVDIACPSFNTLLVDAWFSLTLSSSMRLKIVKFESFSFLHVFYFCPLSKYRVRILLLLCLQRNQFKMFWKMVVVFVVTSLSDVIVLFAVTFVTHLCVFMCLFVLFCIIIKDYFRTISNYFLIIFGYFWIISDYFLIIFFLITANN